jgi:hypothetical protein
MPPEAHTDERMARLLRRLDEAWAELKASYSGLSDAQLTQAGVTGDWSVRDVLAHVTTWEEEALKYLPWILDGRRPPRYVSYGGIDAFNELRTEQKRRLSLADVRKQLDDTHQRLIEFVTTVPADQLGSHTRFRRRLHLDTYGHYREHAEAIRRWRNETHPAE